jgi:dsDNA-specific endonuclease/ATPase MutS2
VEAEEEIITNQLQEKLNKLQKEKIQMEISLEQEQEAMVNRLQKQLDDMRTTDSPRRARMASGDYKYDKRSSSLSEIPPSNQVVEMMRAEVLFD